MEILTAQSRSHRIGPLSCVGVRVHSAARHQLRAQLAWLGRPIVGDEPYGGPAIEGLDRHLLHAHRLAFVHPDGGPLVLESILPEAFSPFTDT